MLILAPRLHGSRLTIGVVGLVGGQALEQLSLTQMERDTARKRRATVGGQVGRLLKDCGDLAQRDARGTRTGSGYRFTGHTLVSSSISPDSGETRGGRGLIRPPLLVAPFLNAGQPTD